MKSIYGKTGKYYILISKSKDEIGFLNLLDTMNIIIEKNKEFAKGMKKAKIAFNNFCKVMGKCAIKDLKLRKENYNGIKR